VSVPDRRAEQRHGADALQRARLTPSVRALRPLSGRADVQQSVFFSEQGIDISRGAAI